MGDSHWVGRVEKYATNFEKEINSYEQFIEELNKGRFSLVRYKDGKYREVLDTNYSEVEREGKQNLFIELQQ